MNRRADSQTGEFVPEHSRAHRAGRTIILITHEREAAEWADRILILRDGQIREEIITKHANV